MASTHDDRYAMIVLQDIDNLNPIPERRIVLHAPAWSVNVGRGTSSGDESLRPGPLNAWFDSRVMSRSHAVISADPDTKEISIMDVGSMHGTHLAGRRLKTNETAVLWNRDIVTLGADVSRGPSFFNAVKLDVSWSWWDDGTASMNDNFPSAQPTHNTFSVEFSEDEGDADLELRATEDSYDEDGGYDVEEILDDEEQDDEDEEELADQEIEVVEDSFRSPSIEVVMPPPRTFTVPDSDLSDAHSYPSSREDSEDESPTSSSISPTKGTEFEKRAQEASKALHDAFNKSMEAEATKSKHVTATSPADVIMSSHSTGSYDESDTNGWSAGPVNAGQSADGGDHERPLSSGVVGSSEIPVITVDNIPCPVLGALASAHDRAPVHRTPSPSDAAMAKPSTHDMMQAPPFIQDSQYVQEWDDAPGPSQARSTSAWTGHNSVLYDYMPDVHKYWDYSRSDWNSTVSRDDLTLPPLEPSRLPGITERTMTYQLEVPPVAKQSPKRKADQISSDTASSYITAQSPELSKMTLANAEPIANAESENTVQSPFVPSEADISVQTTELDSQPPRKKLKKNKQRSAEQNGSGTGGFVKLAAATIVGVAIGTVGTIVGLAALPPIA